MLGSAVASNHEVLRPPAVRRRAWGVASCLALSMALLATGCAASPATEGHEAHPGASDQAPRVLVLPEGWAALDLAGFELSALAWPPGDRSTPARLEDGDLAELEAALEPFDAASELLAVRAAVLLARSGDPRAIEVIVGRLEQRWMGPTRASDASDVVATAGLASFGRAELLARDVPARLVELCAGEVPHPDLEVRVEIAALALGLGRDEPLPFLLAVLRAGTGPEPWPDFERKQTLAWSKTRAAAALTARAGTELRFTPEGSFADQRAEAARLEALLAAPR